MRLPLLACAAVCAALWLAGCAFVPRHFAMLDEARAAADAAAADAKVARYASSELGWARNALEEAFAARDTLQDPALVDHLAYLARQRVAIVREAANLNAVRAASTRDTPPALRP
jgi:hypothetical protein